MKAILIKISSQICKKAYLIIFLFLVTFSAVFLTLSFVIKPSASWSDLFVNLTASFASALVTVFFIDLLRESNKETKWHDSKSVAKDDLYELTNMLISYITIPFGYKITDYQIDDSNLKEDAAKVLSQILNDILQKDLEIMIRKLNFEKWEHLELNLLFLKPAISEYLQVYNEILSPELLTQLLKTRRVFNKFHFAFGLINIGWIKDRKSPPSHFLTSLAKNLREYFVSVSNLSKIVYEY